MFAGAGGLEASPTTASSVKIDFCIKAMQDTFADANGDFQQQDSEKKNSVFNLAAAVSNIKDPHADMDKLGREMRVFAIGDADAVSDAVLGNEANAILFIDAMRWLGGEESFTGAITSTEDVKIEHTKQKDLVLFYGTIFFVPAVVAGLGLLLSRRSRGKTSQPPAPTTTHAAEGKGV